MHLHAHSLYLATVAAALLAAADVSARTWTDSTGKFQIDAELIAVEDDVVRLKKASGKTIRVPLNRLSAADREFIAGQENAALRARIEKDQSSSGIVLVKPVTTRLDFGAQVTAEGEPCRRLELRVPVPAEWPEQSVRIVDEEQTRHVSSVSYKTMPGGSRQMIVSIPTLPAGETAQARVTFEITRSIVQPPGDVSQFILPKKLNAEARRHLGSSPQIETDHPDIVAKARELASPDATAWEQVERIYDFVRDHITLEDAELRGALAALRDGRGDCEECTSLFIALCRVQKIPARLVWIPGHCYPEFYLQDHSGKGHWIPCESAGSRVFGGMPRKGVILQKGDNFKLPHIGEPLRYLREDLVGFAGRPRFSSLHDNRVSSQFVEQRPR